MSGNPHGPRHQIQDTYRHQPGTASSFVRTNSGGTAIEEVVGTDAPTASTVVVRDASSRAAFADPSAADDAATKGYVDTGSYATADPTASKVVIRDASGRAAFADPAAADDAATKGYVDNSLTVTVNAEAANVITVDIADGGASAAYRAAIRLNTMIEATAAAWTMAETGDGAEVSTTAQASLLFTLSAGGAAQLSVTDVGGGSNTTVYLFLYPLDAPGQVQYEALTFDAA